MEAAARWTGWDRQGLDHCLLRRDADGLCLDGLAICGGDSRAPALRYRVRSDARLRTREVTFAGVGGTELRLLGDGAGGWHDARTGAPVPALDGCLDVDIAATPATNSLPILRLGLASGESAEILAAYLPLPERAEVPVQPIAALQRYTCLRPGRFRYEALASGFSAEFAVDGDGLVEDYPGAFRRVPTLPPA